MELDEIKIKIKEYILENFLYSASNDKLADNDSFLEQGIIDSTGILELVAYIEETFSIKLSDDDLVPENLDSINNIGNFILGKTVQI